MPVDFQIDAQGQVPIPIIIQGSETGKGIWRKAASEYTSNRQYCQGIVRKAAGQDLQGNFMLPYDPDYDIMGSERHLRTIDLKTQEWG